MENKVAEAIITILKANNASSEEMRLITEEVLPKSDSDSSEEEFTFTKDQLVRFAQNIIDEHFRCVLESVENAIKRVDFDSHVELSLNYNEIEIKVDDDEIVDQVTSEVEKDVRYNFNGNTVINIVTYTTGQIIRK